MIILQINQIERIRIIIKDNPSKKKKQDFPFLWLHFVSSISRNQLTSQCVFEERVY
jgi:hypothetical protein